MKAWGHWGKRIPLCGHSARIMEMVVRHMPFEATHCAGVMSLEHARSALRSGFGEGAAAAPNTTPLDSTMFASAACTPGGGGGGGGKGPPLPLQTQNLNAALQQDGTRL